MKPKSIFIGGVIIACLALGIFAFVKLLGGSAPAADDQSGDDNVQTIIPVQVGQLKRVTLHRYVTGYGTVEPAPATENSSSGGGPLATPGAGIIAKINVVAGQPVKRGDVLVELNSAGATFDYAQAEVERQKQLMAQQNTSLKNVEDAAAQLASLEVIAPVDGTVTRLDVTPGQAVDVNTVVAEVVDLTRLAVKLKIPASQAVDLKTGEDVQVGEDPQSTLASLSFVSPAVDAGDGTVSAWAALPADSGWRPGQFAPVKIITLVETNALAAPAESVVTDNDGHSVISSVSKDIATQWPVTTGLREGDWVEVAGTNLEEDASVVTVGAYGLPAQTKISIVRPADDTSATNSPAAQ
ncbi:MAG TPA: efflux RND transporter periplasmic adaptor subunit [Verrucomicrobiae bacterium]|jgi:multidrug efflux pump subunit AcrA (membrane-fusion protein)